MISTIKSLCYLQKPLPDINLQQLIRKKQNLFMREIKKRYIILVDTCDL